MQVLEGAISSGVLDRHGTGGREQPHVQSLTHLPHRLERGRRGLRPVFPGTLDLLSLGVVDQAGTARPHDQRADIGEEVVGLTVRERNASLCGVDEVEGRVTAYERQLIDVH